MADYYPLIARAISGLDPSAPGESRRALYERARAALIAQLRSVQPPLSESEITRERLSLEEAVRKVGVRGSPARPRRDAPGCRLARGGERGPRRRRVPRHQRGACAAGRAATAAAAVGPAAKRGAAAPPSAPPSLDRRRPVASTSVRRSAQEDRPPRATFAPKRRRARNRRSRRSECRSRRCRRPANVSGAPRRGPENTPPQAPGMRGFRDIAADADDLGRAAAQASRAARKTYANVPSPSPEFDRLEPSMENRGADPDQPYSYDESAEEAERYAPVPSLRASAPTRSRDREPNKRVAPARYFRSRARSPSASC